jgi:prepilin-type N-terminal cleavage/methylation domain-containing protein
MNKQLKKSSGFTIIEVVLVLAIAGLIFLMVFIALPALQRNQRDTQRKNDLSRLQTAVNNYQSNNRGKLPDPNSAAWNTFATNYLKVGGDSFADPTRGDYTFNVTTGDPTYDNESAVITVAPNNTCDGEGITASGSSNRKVAMRLKLEGGGIACFNN